MNFTQIKNGIKEAFMISGYSRAAQELLKLSDRQLDDLGMSKVLLKQGYRGYPWRVEAEAQAIPNNVSQISATNTSAEETMPRTPKAA